MNKQFICLDCVKKITGKQARDLPVDVFNQMRDNMAFCGDTCLSCGGKNLLKLFGMETSYIRGYGFADKKGAKRDMDLHTMVTGRDPYKEHRKIGEKRDIITKLQRGKERSTQPKTIRMSK